MEKLTIRLPDNWHAHLRQDDLLAKVFYHFDIYGRVLCMGNTSPLIETPDEALRYREAILNWEVLFDPIMCIMLTQDTTPEMVYEAASKGIKFIKFIPVGTSTGAVKGLRLDDYKNLFKIFYAIQKAELHLLLHAELMISRLGTVIPFIEREERAIVEVSNFIDQFPRMKITIEHASTENMIDFVKAQDSAQVRATLTPHHAILIYSDVFDSQNRLINPFNLCLPVLKSESDRQAVVEAMVSGDEHFFAGTDAAPHWKRLKKSEKPPAGIFFGSSEYLRYLEIFEKNDALERFEDFTSLFGAEFYDYPLNKGTITIVRGDWEQPIGEYGINYCLGGETLGWRIDERNGKPIYL